jgi:hypothetical protein
LKFLKFSVWLQVFFIFVDVTCWADVSPLPVFGFSRKGILQMSYLLSIYYICITNPMLPSVLRNWDETGWEEKTRGPSWTNITAVLRTVLSSHAWKTSQNDIDDWFFPPKINTRHWLSQKITSGNPTHDMLTYQLIQYHLSLWCAHTEPELGNSKLEKKNFNPEWGTLEEHAGIPHLKDV